MSILAQERILASVTGVCFKRELFCFGDEVASVRGVRRGGVFSSGEDVAG